VDDPPRAADAWRNLRSRSRDERVPTDSRDALQKYAVDQLDKRLPNIRQNPDPKTVSAERKKLDSLKQAVETWLQDKDFANQLQASETKLVAAEFARDLDELTEQAKNSGLTRSVHQELHRKFQSLIAKNGLTPAQKANAEAASQKHLVAWEREDFLKIYNAHQNREFNALADGCENYLADTKTTPYPRPDQSRAEVVAIKTWLEQFSKNAAYQITGITISGMPTGTISDHDPAAEVRNAANGQSVDRQQNNQSGTFTLSIQSASTINWSSKEPIEIGIWDDAIRKKGECFGIIRLKGDFALLDAVSQAHRVPIDQYDFKPYNGYGGLRVRVEVANPDKLRPPPITERK
jgi:hypothetical protein